VTARRIELLHEAYPGITVIEDNEAGDRPCSFGAAAPPAPWRQRMDWTYLASGQTMRRINVAPVGGAKVC
jgi:hypothetical protein